MCLWGGDAREEGSLTLFSAIQYLLSRARMAITIIPGNIYMGKKGLGLISMKKKSAGKYYTCIPTCQGISTVCFHKRAIKVIYESDGNPHMATGGEGDWLAFCFQDNKCRHGLFLVTCIIASNGRIFILPIFCTWRDMHACCVFVWGRMPAEKIDQKPLSADGKSFTFNNRDIMVKKGYIVRVIYMTSFQ